jgi:hypothetical protein
VGDGDVEAVKALLAAGAQVNDASEGGETPLMRATSRGRLEVVRLLLAAGADVNARRADGMTPLIYAAFFGHTEVVRALIDGGADVEARDRLGMRAVDWARSKGALEAADLLLGGPPPERRQAATYEAAGQEIESEEIPEVTESEEILDLPEVDSVVVTDYLADGTLDLPASQGPRSDTQHTQSLQTEADPSAAEPAESSRNGAADRGVLENVAAPASAAAASSIQAGIERPQYGDGRSEESGRRVNTSKVSAAVYRVPSAERSGTEPSPSLHSKPEVEGGAQSGLFTNFFTEKQPPNLIQLVALSLSIMISTAALTWVIFRRDESRAVKSAPEAVSPPAPDVTPPAPQKSDDGAVLTAALNDWLEATRGRDIEKLMSFYTRSLRAYYRKRFVPSSVVRADKAALYGRARKVDISAGVPEISYGKNSPTATMRFSKVFLIESDAGSRSGEVIQELIWRKTKDGWKIISERDDKVVR